MLSSRGSIVPGLNRMRRSVFYGGNDVEKFDRESASILIQSAARGYLVRFSKHRKERLRLANQAAMRVQVMTRQYLARRKLRERRTHFDLQTKSALRLQCLARTWIARHRRDELSERQHSAVKLQNTWRRRVANLVVREARQEFAAACLQRAFMCSELERPVMR